MNQDKTQYLQSCYVYATGFFYAIKSSSGPDLRAESGWNLAHIWALGSGKYSNTPDFFSALHERDKYRIIAVKPEEWVQFQVVAYYRLTGSRSDSRLA